MIRFLFDTDISSYLVKQRFPALEARVGRLSRNEWAISTVTAAKILFGIQSLPPAHRGRIRATDFLRQTQILDWSLAAAAEYARIRHQLRSQTIGDHDIQIAAHAIALDATLITNNTRHFSRVGAPLRIENWVI